MNGYNLVEFTKLWDWRDKFKIWLIGKPAPIWVTHLDTVESTINKLKLTPLAREHYPTAGLQQQPFVPGAQFAQVAQTGQQQAEEIIVPIPDFPGGLTCPHLHFKREIYLLNDEQWKTFSSNIIKGFSAKLSKIGTVSFEQLVKTSEVIDSMA